MTTLNFASFAAQQMPEAQFSWIYAAEALFFVGVAYGLIRWVGRTLRDVGGTPFKETDRERAFMEAVLKQSTVARAATASAPAAVAAAASDTPIVIDDGLTSLPNAGRRQGVTALVHCPGCGRALTEAAYPLPFVTTCDGCARRVNVRGDGPGRIAVVVEERGTINRLID